MLLQRNPSTRMLRLNSFVTVYRKPRVALSAFAMAAISALVSRSRCRKAARWPRVTRQMSRSAEKSTCGRIDALQIEGWSSLGEPTPYQRCLNLLQKAPDRASSGAVSGRHQVHDLSRSDTTHARADNRRRAGPPGAWPYPRWHTTFLLPQALLLASSAQLQPVPRQVKSTTLSWQA